MRNLTSNCTYHRNIASLRGLPLENYGPNKSCYKNDLQQLTGEPARLTPVANYPIMTLRNVGCQLPYPRLQDC